MRCEYLSLSCNKPLLINGISRSAGVVDAPLAVPSCLQDTIKVHVQTELDGRTGETDSEVSDADVGNTSTHE